MQMTHCFQDPTSLHAQLIAELSAMSDEAIQALEEAIQALEEATGKYKAPDLDGARGAFEQQVGLVAAGTPRDCCLQVW